MNLPAINSTMSVLAKWQSQLEEYSVIGENNTPLPLAVLDEISNDIQAAKKPADKAAVTKWAKFLTGAYPVRQMQDPEIYIRSLVFDMSDFPEVAIERAVHKVRRASKFLPSCAEIRMACEEEMKEYAIAEQRVRLHRIGHEQKAVIMRQEQHRKIEGESSKAIVSLANKMRAHHGT